MKNKSLLFNLVGVLLLIISPFLVMLNARSAPAQSDESLPEVIIISSETAESYSTPEEVIEDSPESIQEESSASEEELYLQKYSYIPMTDDLKLHIKSLCDYYDFNPMNIYQLIYSESRYQTTADNGICRGLMQLLIDDNSTYFIEMEDVYVVSYPCDLFDPYVNTTLGIRVLDEWRRVAGEGTTMSDWINYYGWGYQYNGNRNDYPYGDYVTNIDLKSIDFSSYDIVGGAS